MSAKLVRTEKEKIHGLTSYTRYVEVSSDVYQAFVNADWNGFCMATETPNVIAVNTIHGQSRWQFVLHDESLEVMGL